MWTVILFFGRDHQEITTGLTCDEAQELVRISVFSNLDCVNCSIFRTQS